MHASATAAFVLLLSGCLQGDGTGEPPAQLATAAPPPRYDLAVRVSQETADGLALAGVEVLAYVLGPGDAPGLGVPASTDAQGVARFTFREPVRLALRASLPGWTTEGTTVAVDDRVVAGPGIVASDRDVFLPLFRSELRSTHGLTVSTATVAPDGMGGLARPVSTVDLELPDRAKATYFERLSSADVRLAWTETPSERADLSAGLAWGGRVWVAGEPSGPGVLPGGREASFGGPLPAEGRPVDLAKAVLGAAAITDTAVAGDVALEFTVILRFAGQVPPGLPEGCHSVRGDLCVALPPA